MKTSELKAIFKKCKSAYGKSAWSNGVNEYAEELLEFYEENFENVNLATLQKDLLNGAASWYQYSWGGNSLIYNTDIAERLCNASELKRTKGGKRKPNKKEEWLDVQGRALYQAYRRIKEIAVTWTKI